MPAPARFGIAADLHETPAVLRRQADTLAAPLAALVARLGRRRPGVIVTCARGSSAHAATFGKHLIERYLGIPVAEAAPNIATIYRKRLLLPGQLFLAISQSGASDDLVEMAEMARDAGALTVALVNDPQSPLASACEIMLPMDAGREVSVAATKSFIASLGAMLRMTALWTGSDAMRCACDRLPTRLAEAADLDWSSALPSLADATSLVAIGRGPTLAIAREAALKLKETCALHAEAFSSAEFRHGPITMTSSGYPIFVFVPTDQSAAGIAELIDDLRGKHAPVLVAQHSESRRSAAGRLPALIPDQPEADAICLVQSFYGLLLDLAKQRGVDAERPPHLQKVTRTR